MRSETQSAVARRSFLARFGAGLAAFGAALGASSSAAAVQAPAGSVVPWQPARHAEDDWFEQPAAKHRVFFDTTTADTFGDAMRFVSNTFTANRTGYGLTDADLALVICARHQSAPFAFNDVMWAKYGSALAERAAFTDPKTKAPPVVNVFQAAGYGAALRNNGLLLDTLLKRGVRLAVCGLSTRAAASLIAQKNGGKVDDVFTELSEHLVPNARIVPAGIVAVNRAQERGYSIASIA